VIEGGRGGGPHSSLEIVGEILITNIRDIYHGRKREQDKRRTRDEVEAIKSVKIKVSNYKKMIKKKRRIEKNITELN
jgi:hypothetical protein